MRVLFHELGSSPRFSGFEVCRKEQKQLRLGSLRWDPDYGSWDLAFVPGATSWAAPPPAAQTSAVVTHGCAPVATVPRRAQGESW